VSGAVQYEITVYELGSGCDSPQISDLDPLTSVAVIGPVMLTDVALTLGEAAFGGHHEIVDGLLPTPVVLPAGHYAMEIRVLDDPLSLFWATANGAASGSAAESAIFGVDTTGDTTNSKDGQRDHAFCLN